MFATHMEAVRGVQLHDLASRLILARQKLPDTTATLNQYVNDSIGFRMEPEQVLYYSPNCYGTADAVGFSTKFNKLRINDLKTGRTQTSMDQLMIYAGLFCLEYKYKPFDIEIELRIYQHDEVRLFTPDPLDVSAIMEKIKHFDKILNSYLKEAES